ncbi:MAG TPA: dipicolinate synthase subunit DpsA [Stellaceae bacterium]|nr:dipicolinate synthase subunit DpsA [Stellaceae bacterium]
MTYVRDWNDLALAVVGGDQREQEIARCAAATGAQVRAFGFPWPERGITGVTRSRSAAEATTGAEIALFPVAGIKDGCLYAPGLATPPRIDETLLGGIAPGGHIFAGSADAMLRGLAGKFSLSLHEYEHDAEAKLMRAPSVVEGVLATLIANTQISIHGSAIAVLGQGTLGRLLAITLHKLGARVHAVARDPVQRAEASLHGLATAEFDGLRALVPHLDILISSVPSRIVDLELMRQLRPGALVMDLASPPGSVDLEAARGLPIKAIWARGLGARAPVTVGRAQWWTIRRRIGALLGI